LGLVGWILGEKEERRRQKEEGKPFHERIVRGLVPSSLRKAQRVAFGASIAQRKPAWKRPVSGEDFIRADGR
jgi:hypothetical protein